VLVFAFGSLSSGIPEDWAASPSRSGVHLVADLSAATADDIAAHVRSSRRPGDIAIASIHWGSNWGFDVDPQTVAFAHRLIDGGVDVVHGHSSHHVRAIEIYGGKLILYGCGDLVTDYEGIGGHEQWRGDLGAMYFARISPRDGTLASLRLVPMQMRRMRLSRPEWSDAEWLRATLNRISRPFGSRFEREALGSLVLKERNEGTPP
jgi:poly-gamma-glutamate synthesis protein (capsule biosynthesis protein)